MDLPIHFKLTKYLEKAAQFSDITFQVAVNMANCSQIMLLSLTAIKN